MAAVAVQSISSHKEHTTVAQHQPLSSTVRAPRSLFTRRNGSLTASELLLPGVSMMLMLVSFHMVYVAADWMVIPRCRSSSIESMTAPTPSLPLTLAKKKRKKHQSKRVYWESAMGDASSGEYHLSGSDEKETLENRLQLLKCKQT